MHKSELFSDFSFTCHSLNLIIKCMSFTLFRFNAQHHKSVSRTSGIHPGPVYSTSMLHVATYLVSTSLKVQLFAAMQPPHKFNSQKLNINNFLPAKISSTNN